MFVVCVFCFLFFACDLLCVLVSLVFFALTFCCPTSAFQGRQDGSHPHQAVVAPGTQFVYVCDLGTNTVNVSRQHCFDFGCFPWRTSVLNSCLRAMRWCQWFRLESSGEDKRSLVHVDGLPLRPGAGPRLEGGVCAKCVCVYVCVCVCVCVCGSENKSKASFDQLLQDCGDAVATHVFPILGAQALSVQCSAWCCVHPA